MIRPKNIKPVIFRQKGFGLALLMAFLLTTVLLGTSLEMAVLPSVTSYVGLPSQNYLAAQEIAKTGMIAVQSDIQTKLNAGTAVTTSYTYPVTTVKAPSNPSALGTLNVVVGSYSATMTAQRGNTYLVNVSAIVGTAVSSLSKLLTMSRNLSVLDTVGSASAAYSLRRLSSTYSGYAIRVVLPSNTSSTQDIGFTASGDLDVGALRTFLGNTALPLDAVPGAIVAFGLRKLRNAYTGYAVNVERSSDSTTKDIGFMSNGDLDVPTLMNFVGSGNGYVMTFYDQSGNGYNSNSVPAVHYLVKSGVLQTMNNRPAILFANSYMGGPASLLPSGHNPRTLNAVYQQTSTSGNPVILGWGQNANYEQSAIIMNNPNGGFWGDNADGSLTVAPDLASHVITITYSNPTITDYLDGTAAGGNSPSPTINTPTAQWIYMGEMTGYAPEMIVYASALSTANRQAIERNQSMYYNLGQSPWGYVSIWYDQSGNGKDATQATVANEPFIVLNGINGRPGIFFNGNMTYLTNTSVSITGTQVSGLAVGVDYTNTPSNGRLLSLGDGVGSDYDWNVVGAADLICASTANDLITGRNSVANTVQPITPGTPFQASATFDGTNMNSWVNGSNPLSKASSGSFSIKMVRIGQNATVSGSMNTGENWLGSVGEALVYPTSLSTANRQLIENDQRSYFMTP